MSIAIFDTIVIVDWSARSKPSPAKPSADAIWWSAARGKFVSEPAYHRTRTEAVHQLSGLLVKELIAGRKVLMGFDFPFGYPSGTAKCVAGAPDVFALWRWISDRIEDSVDNSNNRFAVAEAFNDCFEGIGPLWGRPASWPHPKVPNRATDRRGKHPPERRLVEQRVRRTQPTWKLYTTGAVGSQVLLGLPAVLKLRQHQELGPNSAIWPFEPGLVIPEAKIVLAEIYPSLLSRKIADARREGEINDAAQVRVTAGAYASLDATGQLAALFEGPDDLTQAERSTVEREEGWILGVGHENLLCRAA
ncbi:MAG: hypothetical protein AAF334_09440 [Pseudomonadota bacterium]